MAMSTQTNKERFWDGIVSIFKKQQADVLLKAGDSHDGAPISAHKILLSARSVVFKKMFESDEGKSSPVLETITLSDLKQEELEALVEFIYSDGSMLKAKRHVRSLYRAADKYEIPHLRDLCRDELISSLNSSNALKVLELSQIPFDKALRDAAFTVIKTNTSAISNSNEFKVFVVDHPNLTVEIVKAITAITGGNYCRYCRRQ